MAIKYDIRAIPNSGGTGRARRYVHVADSPAMTADDLYEEINRSCSLTRGDVLAALSALREVMERELRAGRRFCLPEVGWFSVKAEVQPDTEKDADGVRGDDLRVRNVNFRPSGALLQRLQTEASFERSAAAPPAEGPTEAEMRAYLEEYFKGEHCLTRRTFQTRFGLGKSAANRRLRAFTEQGVLRREGTRNSAVYFPPGS